MAGKERLDALLFRAVSGKAKSDLQKRADLEESLYSLWRAAQAAWPDLHVESADFFAFLGERLTAGKVTLDSVRGADLYFACACVQGDPNAARALHERFYPEVIAGLGKVKMTPDQRDELLQALSKRLLVADGESPALMDSYSGRGDLRGWLRVTAVRAAWKLLRKTKREVLVDDDAFVDAAAPAGDPEVQYLKDIYRAEFKRAFTEAFAELTPREKNLLRQSAIDGLSIDELAGLYGAHRATCARWLVQARENLLALTRQKLMLNAKMSETECESVLRLVGSRLDITIKRAFEG